MFSIINQKLLQFKLLSANEPCKTLLVTGQAVFPRGDELKRRKETLRKMHYSFCSSERP